jgi:hypothetical protein
MSDSLRLQVLEYVAAQLDAGGKPTGLHVIRQRPTGVPLTEDLLPAAVVYINNEAVDPGADQSNYARRTFTFHVQLRVKVTDGTSADAAMDPLFQWLTAQIMADLSLGGLARKIEENGMQTFDEQTADIEVAGATVQFAVTYNTLRADLTRKSNS